MSMEKQIAAILAANPDGLKASEIANIIGCTRKSVNSYLYSHTNIYEQHAGYIWTAKSTPQKAPVSSPPQRPIPTSSHSATFDQTMGNTLVSKLTITPSGNGYQIHSTNNQILCSDCNKFFSVHAPACPFCGCPIAHIAELYFTKYSADMLQQQKEQQQAEERLYRQKAVESLSYRDRQRKTFSKVKKLELSKFKVAIERAHALAKDESLFPRMSHYDRFYLLSDSEWYDLLTATQAAYDQRIREIACIQEKRTILKESFPKPSPYSSRWDLLERFDGDAFQTALNRTKFLDENVNDLPYLPDDEWLSLVSVDDKTYNRNVQKLMTKQKKVNEKEITAYCKTHHIPEYIREDLISKNIPLSEVKSRSAYIYAVEQRYRHKNLSLSSYIVYPISEIKERLKSIIMDFE